RQARELPGAGRAEGDCGGDRGLASDRRSDHAGHGTRRPCQSELKAGVIATAHGGPVICCARTPTSAPKLLKCAALLQIHCAAHFQKWKRWRPARAAKTTFSRPTSIRAPMST